MIIPIASDHAGYKSKEIVKRILEEQSISTLDFGTNSEQPVDYPDFAKRVAESVNNEEYPTGILICSSGQGMCMTANKYPHIRAALAWNKEMARLSRDHNNSNVLCLPGQFLNEDELREIVTTWLETGFSGGRHQKRVEKIGISKKQKVC